MVTKSQERIFNAIVELDEDGFFVGEVVELPGCHTQARSLDELQNRLREAIELYLEVQGQRKAPRFVGIQTIRISEK